MKKQHIQIEQLLLYCIDEISIEEKERITSHLEECKQCQNLLKSEKNFIQLLKEYPKPEANDILINRCRSQFKKIFMNKNFLAKLKNEDNS